MRNCFNSSFLIPHSSFILQILFEIFSVSSVAENSLLNGRNFS